MSIKLADDEDFKKLLEFNPSSARDQGGKSTYWAFNPDGNEIIKIQVSCLTATGNIIIGSAIFNGDFG